MRKLASFLLFVIVAAGAWPAHAAPADPQYTVKLSEPAPEGIPPEYKDWPAYIQYEAENQLAVGAADKDGALPNFVFGQGLCSVREQCNFMLRVYMGLDSNETPTWQFIHFVLERTDNHKRLEGFMYGQLADGSPPYRCFRRLNDAWQELKYPEPQHTQYSVFAAATWDYIQAYARKQREQK